MYAGSSERQAEKTPRQRRSGIGLGWLRARRNARRAAGFPRRQRPRPRSGYESVSLGPERCCRINSYDSIASARPLGRPEIPERQRSGGRIPLRGEPPLDVLGDLPQGPEVLREQILVSDLDREMLLHEIDQVKE